MKLIKTCAIDELNVYHMLYKSSLLHPNYILLLKNIYSLNNKLNSSSKDTKEKRLINIFDKWVADPSEVKN